MESITIDINTMIVLNGCKNPRSLINVYCACKFLGLETTLSSVHEFLRLSSNYSITTIRKRLEQLEKLGYIAKHPWGYRPLNQEKSNDNARKTLKLCYGYSKFFLEHEFASIINSKKTYKDFWDCLNSNLVFLFSCNDKERKGAISYQELNKKLHLSKYQINQLSIDIEEVRLKFKTNELISHISSYSSSIGINVKLKFFSLDIKIKESLLKKIWNKTKITNRGEKQVQQSVKETVNFVKDKVINLIPINNYRKYARYLIPFMGDCKLDQIADTCFGFKYADINFQIKKGYSFIH